MKRILTTVFLLLSISCSAQQGGPGAQASPRQNVPTQQVTFVPIGGPGALDPNLAFLTLDNEMVGGAPHLLLKIPTGPSSFSTVTDLSAIAGGGITGSGSNPFFPEWLTSSSLENSSMQDSGSGISYSHSGNGFTLNGSSLFFTNPSSDITVKPTGTLGQNLFLTGGAASSGSTAGNSQLTGGQEASNNGASVEAAGGSVVGGGSVFISPGSGSPVGGFIQLFPSGGVRDGTPSNSDLKGTLAFSASTTSASYSFTGSYISAPSCFLGQLADPGSGVRVWISTLNTTTLQLSASSAVSISVDYGCIGGH